MVLASLLLLASQDGSAAPPCPFDRVIPLVIDATDPVLEGHGRSKRVEYVCEFSGTLHAWTQVETDLDTFLRVEDGDGKLNAEDDDSGGGKTPYLKLQVEAGRKLAVIVAASKAEATGQLALHLIAAPETLETRQAAEEAQKAIAEAKELRSRNELDAARELVRKATDALLPVGGGEESELVGQAFWDLGRLCGELNLPEATALRRSRRHCERTLPPDHPDRLRSMVNLAVIVRTQGYFAEARNLFQSAYEGFSRTLPDDDRTLQIVRQNLANACVDLVDYDTARALEQKVLEIYSKTEPADSFNLAWARQCHARTLSSVGDWDGARQLDEQVLEVFARTRPDDDQFLALARSNLSTSLWRAGELERCRALEEKALAVVTMTMPEGHRSIQESRLSLAVTLSDLGDAQQARLLLEAAIEALEHTVPEDDPALQMARINLATILDLHGNAPEARRLLNTALENLAHTLPETNETVLRARLDLATCLYALGEWPQAKDLLNQVLESLLRVKGEQAVDVQNVRFDLASILRDLGEIQAARSLQEQALEAYSRIYPEDHSLIQDTRRELAHTILGQAALAAAGSSGTYADRDCDFERCTELCTSLCRSLVRAARGAVVVGSSREAEERCAGLESALDLTLSVSTGFGLFPPDPALDREAFLLCETTRGAGLVAAAVRRSAGTSEESARSREALRRASDELAALTQHGAPLDRLRSALAERERAERALADDARRRAGPALSMAEPDPAALAAKLEQSDALVGFHRYERGGWEFPEVGADVGPVETGVPSLCAFVLRRGPRTAGGFDPFVLTRVELGPIAAIEDAVNAWRRSLDADGGRGSSLVAAGQIAGGRQDVHDGSVSSGRELRRLVFDPLLPALGDTRRVIAALDGVLHLVPLDALPLEREGGRGELVGDCWRLETRSTLSEILAPPAKPSGQNLLVALGGIDYDRGPDPLVAEARSPTEVARAPRIGSALLRGGAWDRGFEPLPETRVEVRGIASLLQGNHAVGGSATVLEAQQASRDALTELAPRARWLHVATHGWFAPESVRSWGDPRSQDAPQVMNAEEMVRGMSPMLLCGLALAGANGPENAVGRVPGLITAEDISALDLSNCELAVLSACDTGVGDQRRAGQGLASLQRALQMADARSVITSLWKVPDEATRELMVDFYRRLWVEKKPKWQALWEAKKKIREAKNERGQPKYSTHDWAAWVLTGDPN